MSAPRLEINLDKILHNAKLLVTRLAADGITVTGVTKAFLGAPQIARTMLRAGISSLGDSRIENIELLRHAGVTEPISLIRSPMLSQVDRVVASANTSFNTEIEVLTALSQAAMAAGKIHEVLLMVELGDLREGILPADVEGAVHDVARLAGIRLVGLGANLACRSGVSPDNGNMTTLSDLAELHMNSQYLNSPVISGGNSSNLQWVFAGGRIGRINNLRLGEAILLGTEALNRQPIPDLYTDAITLVAEVIESKMKPARPWGAIGQSAFNTAPHPAGVGQTGNETISQSILAIGRQDADPGGLQPPPGIEISDASSDHLIVSAGKRILPVGAEISFQLDYSALLRAMTSPFVGKSYIGSGVNRRAISRLPSQPAAA